ncbi:hypothetical protein BDP81DRAFT_186425 [Colletotrichum phormii]|uniref:Uncharacterized protein n=1 Tax=Colletotrichum phormii TaxID=359342 RepID=A0AAI9ZY28_9PEZI|nr:uncharacterized protein BDP81DRAFT_186425 [Colletotrichum phormii]KAK1639981.1 hypothetical protein BDP81DRAFT_186425 [Colletotrichum phormii]
MRAVAATENSGQLNSSNAHPLFGLSGLSDLVEVGCGGLRLAQGDHLGNSQQKWELIPGQPLFPLCFLLHPRQSTGRTHSSHHWIVTATVTVAVVTVESLPESRSPLSPVPVPIHTLFDQKPLSVSPLSSPCIRYGTQPSPSRHDIPAQRVNPRFRRPSCLANCCGYGVGKGRLEVCE